MVTAGTELQWGTRSTRDVDGVTIHTEVAGPGGATTIGALHGFASGTFTWAGVARSWADEHRVVAWDRPPFGRSGRPSPRAGEDDPYGLPAALAHAATVLGPETGSKGLVLVGHSAGALLATQIVLAGTMPVDGLVLVAPALDGAPPPLVRRMAALPGVASVAPAALRVGVLAAAPALRAVSRHRTPLTDATAAETARLLRRPGTAAALWHLTATWQPPALLDSLGPLGIPTSVIGGTDDRISTPSSTRAVAERLQAELHLLDGVGHAPQEQVPEVFAGLVGAFVDSVAR